jgi:hypothetical protein
MSEARQPEVVGTAHIVHFVFPLTPRSLDAQTLRHSPTYP